MEVRPEPTDSAVTRRLIAELDEELSVGYLPEQRFGALPTEEIAAGRGHFVVAWLDGEPAGCGAIRMLSEDSAELKRMYVVPAARGRGVSKAVLAALEGEAAALGATRVVLETGDKQLAALGLYAGAGYARIPCFGAYAASPTSICMAKTLTR